MNDRVSAAKIVDFPTQASCLCFKLRIRSDYASCINYTLLAETVLLKTTSVEFPERFLLTPAITVTPFKWSWSFLQFIKILFSLTETTTSTLLL